MNRLNETYSYLWPSIAINSVFVWDDPQFPEGKTEVEGSVITFRVCLEMSHKSKLWFAGQYVPEVVFNEGS